MTVRAATAPTARRRLLPLALCALFAAQCVWFVGSQSFAADEADHLYGGLDAWRHSRFEFKNDHPPLARMLFALPALALDAQIDPKGHRIQSMSPDPVRIAWAARPVNIVMGLGLGVLLWSIAARRLSEGAANFALALFALSPSAIAHFSVIGNDGMVTLLLFALAVAWLSWHESPTPRRLIVLGLVSGLFLSAKFSAPPLVALVFAYVALRSRLAGERHALAVGIRRTAIVAAAALFVVWGSYRFHVSTLTAGQGHVQISSPNRPTPMTAAFTLPIAASLPLPGWEYVEGLRRQAVHARDGHSSFFFGRIGDHAGIGYFPAVIALKWPPVVLAAMAVALALAMRRWRRISSQWLLFALLPAAYFAIALVARVNIGERHILPVYPFVLLLAAWAWETTRGWGRHTLLSSAALLVLAADISRFAPDYLSYFTPAVRPEDSYRYLSDSNVDWGQGLLALRRFQEDQPDRALRLAYFGRIEPALYGIRAEPLGENERASGLVVVSATMLSGQLLRQPTAYHWLLAHPRVALPNHSLHVFDVPERPRAQREPL